MCTPVQAAGPLRGLSVKGFKAHHAVIVLTAGASRQQLLSLTFGRENYTLPPCLSQPDRRRRTSPFLSGKPPGMRVLPCPAPGAGQALGSFGGTGTMWKGS